MSNISSINFKKTKSDFQVWHNDKNLVPSYLIGAKNIKVNRCALKANELRDELIQNAKKAYFERTKQKCQAKSFLWSAVLNIKSSTTMNELENLAQFLEQKYGIRCYQIAIHKDEGHINENNEISLNEHAHMEFVTLDERGINRQRDFGKYLNGQKILSQIQNDVAKMLNMHRGISVKKSKTKRIEPRVLASIKQKEQNSKTEQKTFYELMIKNAKNKSKELKEFYERKLKDEEAKNEKILALENELKQEKNSKINDENLKEIKLKTKQDFLKKIINKIKQINENNDKVNEFMNGCVETKTELDNEFYKALKAIMLTHEANVYSKNFNDYNELLAEYAKLRYALENSLPSLEFEKKLIFMLKIYNYNQIAKLMKFPKYENINLQELDTIQALNMLS